MWFEGPAMSVLPNLGALSPYHTPVVRDPTKTDSTDLDFKYMGNKLNYETHRDDMNTTRQEKKLGPGAHGEEKHKHSPGA